MKVFHRHGSRNPMREGRPARTARPKKAATAKSVATETPQLPLALDLPEQDA
jgi:hypothetical protein